MDIFPKSWTVFKRLGVGFCAFLLLLIILGLFETKNSTIQQTLITPRQGQVAGVHESQTSESDANLENKITPQPEKDNLETNITELEETPKNTRPTTGIFDVIKVVDGDTIAVSINGKNQTLRLIGMDTPETVDPRKPVQCFGIEASNKAKELLNGKRVKIEADPTQGELDKYNRLLRYVFLEDGTNYQHYMIQQGYAHEYTYNLPYKYQLQFIQAEEDARFAKRGLWAEGVCNDESQTVTEPQTTTSPASSTPSAPSGWLDKYDCSSDKYNCANFKTHDEAQKVFEYCGGAKNDVHRLDGSDKDGLACESLP